jgi:sporulation protein YtfJ
LAVELSSSYKLNLDVFWGIVLSNVENLMGLTLEKIRSMVDVDSVIGSAIKVSPEVTVIPVSKVSYGFASGGSDFSCKKPESVPLFGGGSGSGVTIAPVGFLVVSSDDVRFLQVDNFSGALDRAIALIPELVRKISKNIKNKNKNDENSDESPLKTES